MIKIIAKFEIQENKVSRATVRMAALAAASKSDKGCISYELFEDINNANTLFFVESWESTEEQSAHMNTPHIKAFDAAARHFLAGDPLVAIVKSI